MSNISCKEEEENVTTQQREEKKMKRGSCFLFCLLAIADAFRAPEERKKIRQ